MKTGRPTGSGTDAGETGNTGGEDGESVKQQTVIVGAAGQMFPPHSSHAELGLDCTAESAVQTHNSAQLNSSSLLRHLKGVHRNYYYFVMIKTHSRLSAVSCVTSTCS